MRMHYNIMDMQLLLHAGLTMHTEEFDGCDETMFLRYKDGVYQICSDADFITDVDKYETLEALDEGTTLDKDACWQIYQIKETHEHSVDTAAIAKAVSAEITAVLQSIKDDQHLLAAALKILRDTTSNFDDCLCRHLPHDRFFRLQALLKL